MPIREQRRRAPSGLIVLVVLLVLIVLVGWGFFRQIVQMGQYGAGPGDGWLLAGWVLALLVNIFLFAGLFTVQPNEGKVLLDGDDVCSEDVDPVILRARVGMVFQKPNPFPKSIYDNVAYGPRIHGLTRSRAELDDLVHTSLERAGLIEEVSDRLDAPGGFLIERRGLAQDFSSHP